MEDDQLKYFVLCRNEHTLGINFWNVDSRICGEQDILVVKKGLCKEESDF